MLNGAFFVLLFLIWWILIFKQSLYDQLILLFPSTFQDSSSMFRKQFIDKVHKLLKEQAIPTRYACAFAFCISDSLKDLQDDVCLMLLCLGTSSLRFNDLLLMILFISCQSRKYMAEFIEQYSKIAQIHQTSVVQDGSMTFVPAYIVVFLIYILAHDSGFPHVDCQDENVYAQFCR